ncbi:MAG: zinc transporter ZupT [Muribaculaceae bacterium]|nr:zinc transporter ZupT [Muribaculaceae bacterium]
MDITLTFESVMAALALTFVAGMSTGIGSLMAFFTKATNTRFLSGALGLSAGVMVYVSFMELIPDAIDVMQRLYSGKIGMVYILLAFFGGMGLIAAIDFFIPEDENPHEFHAIGKAGCPCGRPAEGRLRRTGLMLALAIGIHNFPEGMATFVSALDGLDVALPIVIAIAIHNIPEGIAVSVPIYHSSGNRRKALSYSILTGLAEPVGALFGMAFLLPFWTPGLSGSLLAAVAGVMVYISFDELLPSAEEYGHHHFAIGGVIVGMVVMAFSLLLF